MPGGVSYVETLATLQADGPALTTNNTMTSMLNPQAKALIKADSLFIGKAFRITALGRTTTLAVSSTTNAVGLAMGGTNIFTGALSAPGQAVTNGSFRIRMLMTCRAIGASANFMTQGIARCTLTTGFTLLQGCVPPSSPAVGANFDNTIDQLLDFQMLIQTASITSIQLHQYCLEALN